MAKNEPQEEMLTTRIYENNQLQAQKELDVSARGLRWNYLILTTLGLWPASFSKIRFGMEFAYFSFEMVMEYLDLLLFIDNFGHVLMNLVENVALSQIFVRLLMVWLHNKRLGEVIDEVYKDFDARKYTEEERKTFVTYHAKSQTLVKLMITNAVVTVILYYTKPLLEQMEEIIDYANGGNSTFDFILPYRFYVLYDLKDVSTYFWTYVSLLPFAIVSSCGELGANCLMITLSYHVSGQMAVLAMRIIKIDTNSSNCTDEIYKIVRAHVRLIRLADTIKDAFSTILLVHLIGVTLVVCMLGYFILLSLAIGENTSLLPLVTFISLALVILYAHCTVGESLITESERLTNAYYNCNWYNMSKQNARLIILCIARSQKPLQLTAGKFTTFCLVTLTTSIKTSMGYLSVLRTVM